MGSCAMEYDEKYTKAEVYELCQNAGISGISKDNKAELIRKLLVHEGKAINITRPGNISRAEDVVAPADTVPATGVVGGSCRDCPKYRRPDKECMECWTEKRRQK